MNKFLNYYNSLCTGANTPSVFSYDPFLMAMKELLFSELEQVVYYIEKLKSLNIDMKEYTDKVIDFISILIVDLDFEEDSFFIIIKDLYENKKKLENLYISNCQNSNLTPQLISSSPIDISDKNSILKALNNIEQNSNLKNKIITKNQKALYEIMVNLILKACNNLIDLKKYDVNLEEAKNQVLKLINNTNIPDLCENAMIEVIKDFSKCNYKIMKTLYETITKKYGPITESEVTIGQKKGKAILVSGSSFLDLEKILEAAKDLNINIYTHHELLSAFEYEKFKNYKNLIGHFQKSTNNFPLDYASFPGPIYISRNATTKIDVIRGQIYTSSKYPALGIAKIEKDNFEPIIKYALESEGFIKDETTQNIKIGYSPDFIEENIKLIINKVKNNTIKNIIIIGLTDRLNSSAGYIKKFCKNAALDNFIISFAFDYNRENFWNVNSYYDFSLVYKIIEQLKNNLDNVENLLSIYITDCNTSTVSHIFNLIYLGINKIYLGPCCPEIVNPSIIDGLYKFFNVKSL